MKISSVFGAQPWRAPEMRIAGVKRGSVVDGHIPDGDPATAWDRRKDSYRLVGTLARRSFTIVVVGTGLAGSGAATALAELGYNVHAVTFHDAPRRAHSVAAQGGINAARGKAVDGDSLARFVRDTVKGGDFRAREAEAFRLGEESVHVIDHLSAIGAPFAREYGGSLATRSFGGVQVSRTYYTRGQTGQQLMIASSGALLRQVKTGKVTLHTRCEMLELIMDDGVARGVVVRDLLTGAIEAIPAHAVVIASGGYGSIYYHSTLAMGSNASALWRAHRRGAYLAHASFIQFHPTALPVVAQTQAKTTLMSESLRNDGRIWVPLHPGDTRPPQEIPEAERDYYLERMYPAFGNLCPRDIASRAATERITAGYGVGPFKNSVYLDFSDALARKGKAALAERYGNLFTMYRQVTGEDPYTVPMRIAPGAHFTMGGLWTDFDQMSSIPGLFVGGEAGWAYHGANRLGANSLLSACVDGWFTLPYSIPNYLADHLKDGLLPLNSPPVEHAVARARTRTQQLLDIGGHRAPSEFHRALGEILTRGCGVVRSRQSLEEAIDAIRKLRSEFWVDLAVPGSGAAMNQTLEKAGRVADFMELGELMCVDALDREESCGAHFRSEHQRGGEAQRDDAHWACASLWQTEGGEGRGTLCEPLEFTRHVEHLEYSAVPLAIRSYS
jgi:succinate dehydrogenase / fumarate reductase flavoprotein subunit